MGAYREFLNRVVIVSAVRTPIGSLGGKLASLTGPRLGAIAVRNAVQRANISPSSVQQCILGNVISAGAGQAPARQAAVFGGLPYSTECTTINKVCSSGLKAISFATQAIMLGHQDIVVAGGFESMSNVPYYLDNARSGLRYGHSRVIDGIIHDGLWDVYNNYHMGSAGELCAKKYGVTREEQDRFAIGSYQKVAHSVEKGFLKTEIVGVEVEQKKGPPILIEEDEEPKKVDFDKVPTLKPAFDKNGTITAANAPAINDGACALVLMNESLSKSLGLKPLATILGFADAEGPPEEFPTAPSLAVPKALAMAGVKSDQIDFWEINEAFSVVVLANMKQLNLPSEKVNVDGGAVALGHPIGMSGARLVTHLTHLLKRHPSATLGCAAICNGGGGASAMVIQKAE